MKPHEGVPSRAGYQKGCRCEECRRLNTDYLAQYRRKKVPLAQVANGSPQWHTHKGQPSATTARTWGCSHDECLRQAGLYLDIEGVVRLMSNNMIDPVFGLVVPRKAGKKKHQESA